MQDAYAHVQLYMTYTEFISFMVESQDRKQNSSGPSRQPTKKTCTVRVTRSYSFFVLHPVSQNSGPEPLINSNCGNNLAVDDQNIVKKYFPGCRKSATLIIIDVWVSLCCIVLHRSHFKLCSWPCQMVKSVSKNFLQDMIQFLVP